jgi:O-antigen ligase
VKPIRIGIFVMLAFAVALHGVVEVWSEAVFEVGAAVLLVAWAILRFREAEDEIAWNPLLWPLAALLALGVAQLAFGWTVYPYLTKVALLRWAAVFLYGFLAAQVFREKRDLRGLVWFLISLGFVVGLFAMVQFFTFNGKLYWFRELKLGGIPFGPYVNRNHFAGFMELIAPLSLALLMYRGVRREQTALGTLFAIVQVAALLLSASRGGIVSFVFAMMVLLLLLWLQRRGETRMGGVALVLVAAGALIAWLGVGQVIERFSKVGANEVDMSRRAVITRGAWKIFLDHRWTGTGAGTLEAVYPLYEGLYDGYTVEHAHNDYAELLADMGAAGGIAGLAFLALLLVIARRRMLAQQSPFSLAYHTGALAACCGFLLHSLVDFNLQIPSNAALFLIMALLATSPALALEEVRPMERGRRRHSGPSGLSVSRKPALRPIGNG